MAALSTFIKQCLSEDKYGTQYVSEIEERAESMNLAQLQGMHTVLTQASKTAKVDVWKDGNDAILEHVTKWLEIRTKEHNVMKEREEEVARKFRMRQKAKEIQQREKEHVITQLRNNARKQAEEEIHVFEANRRAQYKAGLYDVVDAAETKRLNFIKYGCSLLIFGCISIGVLPTFLTAFSVVFILTGILVVVMISFYIFYKGYQAGIVPPYDENYAGIERATDTREEELFLKALNHLKETEREYERRMELDKQERKKRKAERREKEIMEKASLPAALAGASADMGDESSAVATLYPHAPGREAMHPIHESEEEVAHAEAMTTSDDEKDKGGRDHLPRPYGVAPSKSAGEDDVLPFGKEARKRSKKLSAGKGPEQDDEDKDGSAGCSRSDADGEDGDRSSATGIHGVSFTRRRMIIKKLALEKVSDKLNCCGSDVFVRVTVGEEEAEGMSIAATDTQKCVGESLLWRLDSAPPPAGGDRRDKKKGKEKVKRGKGGKNGVDSSAMAVDVSSSSACVVTFSLCDSKNPDEPDAKAVLSGSDVFLAQSIVDSNGTECRVVNIDLCRNEVIKIADLSVEYVLHAVNLSPR